MPNHIKEGFWQGFSHKQAASAKIKNWLAKLKRKNGGVESFLRRGNLKGFSNKGLSNTKAGRSVR